ncbi:MAG: sugar phosphate isomerase/epimerase [Candidatus Hydrogenedentes bacterium]|nr:sugar phosphate isomerase/epimerase [Candidatus Hydrogenedentota bacterium]
MRPGFWTAYLLELSPEDAVRAFAGKGWFELELSSEHAEALLGRGNPAETGAAFRAFAAELGVSVPQGHLWLECDILGPEQDATLDALKQWLDLFLALDIRAAVLHPGGAALLRDGCDARAVFDAQVQALLVLTQHVAGSALTICLENLSVAPEAEDLCAIIDGVGNPHLGICLDTGHLNLASGDQLGFIRRAGSHLKALHLADNDRSGDQHLLPYGRGNVPWEDVVTGLKEIGYAGLANFEVPGERRCPFPIQLAKLDYAKALFALMFGEPAADPGTPQ